MKAAFKWRLQNGLYGYITDESGNGDPFAYDIAQQSRIYSGGTIIPEYPVDEGAISTSVSKMSKQSYTDAFNKFKQFINSRYPQVSLLDVIYYYNMENDECTASATSLKCSATDIIFEATAVTGDTLSVTVDNEQSRPDDGDPLKYRLDFVFPIEGGGGGSVVYTSVTSNSIVATSITANELNVTDFNTTNINTENITSTSIATSAITTSSITTTNVISNAITGTTIAASAITTSSITTNVFTSQTINSTSITADTIVKNGGTNYQYLMADGSVTILSAGTNVTIDTALTTDGKVITINSTGGGGGDTNTWRPVNVNGTQILDSGINTSALTLSADTNVTLTHAGNGVVKIGATDTKNTTGSKQSTSKLYLIGATAQTVNNSDGIQTYSNAYVYEQNGGLCANALSAKTISAITISADTVSAINDVKVNGTSITPPIGTIMPWLGHFVYSAYWHVAHLTNCYVPDGWIGAVGSSIALKCVESGVTDTSLNLINTANRDDYFYLPLYTSGSTHEEDLKSKVTGVKFSKFEVAGYRADTTTGTTTAFHALTESEKKIWAKFLNIIRLSCTYSHISQRSLLDLSKWDTKDSTDYYSIYEWFKKGSYFFPGENFYYVMKLPDLRKKFIVGSTDCLATYGNTTHHYGDDTKTDAMGNALSVGQTGGEEKHALTVDEMPSHKHRLLFQYPTEQGGGQYSDYYLNNNDGGARNKYADYPSGNNNKYNGMEETGGSLLHNNIPPYIAINFIIRYK